MFLYIMHKLTHDWIVFFKLIFINISFFFVGGGKMTSSRVKLDVFDTANQKKFTTTGLTVSLDSETYSGKHV